MGSDSPGSTPPAADSADPEPDQPSTAIPAPPDRGKLLVHLVHGTWADGPWRAVLRSLSRRVAYPVIDGTECWFQSGHAFRKGLEERLHRQGYSIEVRPFVWSGFNSFRARASAAEELLPHLARGVTAADRQLIIGHSHGGNVAMLALKLMAAGESHGSVVPENAGGTRYWMPGTRASGKERRIAAEDITALPLDKVQAAAQDVELVTLATPFLRVEPFGSVRFLRGTFGLAWMTLFCALSVYLLREYGEAVSLPAAYGLAVIAGLGARGLATSRAYVHREIIDRQATAFPGKRCQCLRGIADEAGLAIALGIVGCNLMRTLLVLIGQQLERLARLSVFILVVLYLGVVAAMAYALLADPNDPALNWVAWSAWAGGGLLLLFVCASLLQGTLGNELIWAGFGFLTTVESSPDAAPNKLEVQTLNTAQDSAEVLRHAVYLHPDAADRIVEGLAHTVLEEKPRGD